MGRARRRGGGNPRRALSAALVLAVGLGVGLTVAASPAVALTALVPASDPPATPIVDSSPTDPTTTTTLVWTFEDASPAVCEISQSLTTVATQDPCESPASFDPLPAGTYSFTVYAADGVSAIGPDTPSQSESFTVADASDPPPTPTPTDSPTDSPSPSTSPTDSSSPAPTDTSSPAPTDSPSDSGSPSPADSSTASPPDQSQTSGLPPLPGLPDAPTVEADSARGFSTSPTFTVSDVAEGATVNCSLVGPDGSDDSRITSCGEASQLDLTDADAGSYLFTASQTVAGLTGPIGAASYVFETTPSVVVDAASGAGATPTYTVTGYDAIDTTLHCAVNGPTPTTSPSPATVTSCGPGSVHVAIGSGGPGTYTVSVYATDGAGTVSSTSTAGYEYEPAAPPAPTVTAPTNGLGGKTGTDRQPLFTVTDSENVALTYACSVVAPATVPATVVPAPACGSQTSLDLDGLPDGAYTLQVTVADALGQVSAVGSATYVLDTTTSSPVLSLVDPASSPSADPTPSFMISDAESVDGPDSFMCSWGLQSDSPAPISQPCGTGASVTRSFPATEGDGIYQLVVTATDTLGNSVTDFSGPDHPASSVATYQLEVVTPAPTVVLSDPSTSPASDRSPSFTITETDLVGGPDSYVCSFGLATAPAPVAVACGSGAIVTDSFPAIQGDGLYTLTVTATNSLGGSVRVLPPNAVNDPASTSSAVYTLDATTPVPTITLASGSTPSNRPNPTYTISDTESVSPMESYSCVWSVAGTSAPLSSGACGSGSSTSQQFMTSAGDGIYTLVVTATDALGNTATKSAMYTFDTITSAPTLSLAPGESSPSTLATPKFTITDAETTDTYTCGWGLKGASPAPAAAPCMSGQAFSANSGDGTYELAVTATDALGNAVTDAAGDPATSTIDYVLDTSATAPTVTLIQGESSPSNTPNPTYTISDSDPYDGPDSYTCVWQKAAASRPISSGSCGSGASVTASFLTNQGDGTYTLTVSAKDALGNTATGPIAATTTVSYLLDTTTGAPVIALANGATTPSTNPAPQFTITDGEALDLPETYTCTWRLQGATPISSGPCDPSSGPLQFSASAGDGPYQLTVSATDALGNTTIDAAGDPASTTFDYRLDTRTPAPTVVLSTGLTSPSSNSKPTFVISDSEKYSLPETYTCVWQKTTDTSPISSAACGSGSTTTQLFTASEGDGDYVLTVVASDSLGNSTTGAGSTVSSTTTTYRLDSSTPAPVVTLASPLLNPGNNRTPTFVITDAESVDGPDTFSCQWYIPPLQQLASSGPCDSGVSFPASGTDGAYDLVVTATDTAGNSNTAPYFQYTLDTLPPEAPTVTLASASHSSELSPTWTWREGFDDPTPLNQLTAMCTITYGGVLPWTYGPAVCASTFTTPLPPEDGTYTLSVTLTDLADNTSKAGTAKYVLDATAPAGATVTAASPEGFSRHPSWTITETTDAKLLCTLHRGGPQSTTIVSAEAVCPTSPAVFSLVGQPAGQYTLSVVAVDSSNNRSYAASASYVLRPGIPGVDPPTGQNPEAVWTVHGVAGDRFECSLQPSGDLPAPADYSSCTNHPTFNMRGVPAGTFVLWVRQDISVGGETVTSDPGTASWKWQGDATVSPTSPPTGPSGSGSAPVIKIPPTDGSGPGQRTTATTSKIDSIVQKLRTTGHVLKIAASPYVLKVHPIQLPGAVARRVQSAFNRVGSAGGGTGFPLILVSLVLVFLVVQNRIDRRDPKLALASIAADDQVEFQPPPSRKNLS